MGWDLNGNSNTNPPADFLGTQDSKPLVIKVNKNECLRVDPGGNVRIGAPPLDPGPPSARLEVMGDVLLKTATGAGASARTDGAGLRIEHRTAKFVKGDVLHGGPPTGTDSDVYSLSINLKAGKSFALQGSDAFAYTSTGKSGTRPLSLALQPDGGYVGIGTTKPQRALDVVGDVTASGGIEVLGDVIAHRAIVTDKLATRGTGAAPLNVVGNVVVSGDLQAKSIETPYLRAGTLCTFSGSLKAGAGSELLLARHECGVDGVPDHVSLGVSAIRTKSPTPSGEWNAIRLSMDVNSAPSDVTSVPKAGAALYLSGNGYVGIGTPNPAKAKLDVYGDFLIRHTYFDEEVHDQGGEVRLHVNIDEKSGVIKLQGGDAEEGFPSIIFQPDGGKVGIGTNAPESALHVKGDVKVTGDVLLLGADCAEHFDAGGEPPEPGDCRGY